MKDARLDLGRYITNPFNNQGRIASRLDFREIFKNKHDTDTASGPWVPSRFTSEDLLKAIENRKLTLNPRLNAVPNSPFWDSENQLQPSDYEMFSGLGRFRRDDYDFDEGRALTSVRPEQQPDFNPSWIEAYRLSPTLKPEDRSKNPMPRVKNPDPNGYIMAIAEQRAESEMDGSMSVADLLQSKSVPFDNVKQGVEAVDKQEEEPS